MDPVLNRRETDYFSWGKTILKGAQYLAVGLASAIAPLAAAYLNDSVQVTAALTSAGVPPWIIIMIVPFCAALAAMINNYLKNKDKKTPQ